MEYAVPPANTVINRKSTVSHTWMLMRRRKPAPRPSKSRSIEGHNRGMRRRPPLVFLGRPPFRFEKNRSLPEDIPHTPGGVDKLGVSGVAFDLLAQVADVHVDRALVTELVAPHPCQQRATREYPTRI